MSENVPLEICVNYEAAKLVPSHHFETLPDATLIDTLAECRYNCNGYKFQAGCYIPMSKAPKDYLDKVIKKYGQ